MNRRQLFGALLAAPLAAPALAAVRVGRTFVPDPGAVLTDFSVHADCDGRTFRLTLARAPFPIAGDTIDFRFRDLRLRGLIDTTWTVRHRDAAGFVCHVSGRVHDFTAPDLFGNL